MQTKLPTHSNILPVFPGFYNTIFEDFPLEFNGFYPDEDGEFSDDSTYPDDMEPVGRTIFDAFKKEFTSELQAIGATIEYDEFRSPPYYNYTNDRIWIQVTGPDEETFDKAFDIDTHPDYLERLYYALN